MASVKSSHSAWHTVALPETLARGTLLLLLLKPSQTPVSRERTNIQATQEQGHGALERALDLRWEQMAWIKLCCQPTEPQFPYL